MKRSTRHQVVVVAGGLIALGLFVLGLWPVPGKYPYPIFAIGVATALLCGWRYKGCADDFGAFLVAMGSLDLLATWTLKHWLGFTGDIAILVFFGLLAVPACALVILVVAAGAADPYGDD